jgi:nucleotide-binding universal stress UspA family protein
MPVATDVTFRTGWQAGLATRRCDEEKAMVLVCYDGSDDARAAIAHAGQLMPGSEAIVLTVWEPFLDVMIGSGAAGLGPLPVRPPGETAELESASRAEAQERAAEGARLARAAGLQAQPLVRRGGHGIPEAVTSAAAELDCEAIVIGTRGHRGLKSLLLGSVSHAIMQHADRPVIVVTSEALAERRHRTAAGAAQGTS